MTPMQRLMQLPGQAANMVKTVQNHVQGTDEDKSPVLSPDNAQQNWYNAMHEPDELRQLRPVGGSGGGGGGFGGGFGGGSSGGDQETPAEDGGEGGLSGDINSTQPLR